MKHLLCFTVTILAANCLSVEEQWTSFKEKYNKLYENNAEEDRRFTIFHDNLKVIEEHNNRYEKGETSFYMGINKFADLNTDEFSFKLLQSKPDKVNKPAIKDFPEYGDVPDSYDARTTGAVFPVRDQGDCGSGYAFAAAGAIESLNFLKNNLSIPLSAQEIIDCSMEYGNDGCLSGSLTRSYLYMEYNGITSDATYPYVGKLDECKRNATNWVVEALGHGQLAMSEDALKYIVYNNSPTSIYLYANRIHLYEGGIYDNIEECPNDESLLNHMVLTVGYGSEEGKDYWILKNSWGADWGEKGYIRMLRNPSICGVLQGIIYVSSIRVQ